MTSRPADRSPGSGSDIEAGEIQDPLSQTHLDEIRRDVSASGSTWSDLRQKYPPGKSCFEPLNFSVSSWSALASGDATGLGDDIDADEAYSQAATMAAYGVDILSKALNGPTVDRELTEQANRLFATLCATLMDTRDWHRNSVTKAVSEKVGTFVCILDKLDSSPQTADMSNHTMSLEQGELMIESLEEQRLDKAEKLGDQMTPHSERRMSRSSTHDTWHPYNQSRSHSPNFRRPQQLQNLDTARDNLLRQRPDRYPSNIGLYTHYSASKPAAPKHPSANSSTRRVSVNGSDSRSVANLPTTAAYRSNGRTGPKLSRQTIIRRAHLRHGLSVSAIAEYNNRYKGNIASRYDRTWNRWVDWCERQGIDPTKRSEDNLARRYSEIESTGYPNVRLVPTVYSVWLAIEGDIHSSHLNQ